MGRRAAPKTLRLIGYIRVSRVGGRTGDSFISPAQQRDRITAWCAAYGHDLTAVHEELDESGARADRPKLLAAIEAVEHGRADGIIVAKLDRFGRSLVDGLQLVERLQKAGGTFVSVADGFDLTTDTGRLVLRIMLSLAEFELDRVRGNWADAKARAVARGIHPSALPPFGYQRPAKGQPLAIHPANGPLVAEMFRRRAGGAGYTELAHWLEQRGAVTQRGRPKWSLRAVKDIIRNDVYLGVASAGEDVRNEHAHQALTDPMTFRRAQRPGVASVPRESPSVIRPLLRCAGCRYAMRAERRRYAAGDAWLFTCRNHGGAKSSQQCDEPASVKDTGDVEAWIVGEFLDRLPIVAATMRERAPDLEPLQQAVAFAQTAYEQWRDDTRVQERLGMGAYLDGVASRQTKLDEALAALLDAEAQHARVAVPADVVDVRAHWGELEDHERRAILQGMVECVFIRGKSGSSAVLRERLRVVWKGEPVDLPVRGAWEWLATPFRFGDGLDDDFAAKAR